MLKKHACVSQRVSVPAGLGQCQESLFVTVLEAVWGPYSTARAWDLINSDLPYQLRSLSVAEAGLWFQPQESSLERSDRKWHTPAAGVTMLGVLIPGQSQPVRGSGKIHGHFLFFLFCQPRLPDQAGLVFFVQIPPHLEGCLESAQSPSPSPAQCPEAPSQTRCFRTCRSPPGVRKALGEASGDKLSYETMVLLRVSLYADTHACDSWCTESSMSTSLGTTWLFIDISK